MNPESILTKVSATSRGYERLRFATIPELLRFIGANCEDDVFARSFPWIQHDATAQPEFRVSRRTTHDGTLLFTQEAVSSAVRGLVERTTYYKATGPWDRIQDVRYTVTGIVIARVFGTVSLRCGRRPGMRESVRIGLRCVHEAKTP